MHACAWQESARTRSEKQTIWQRSDVINTLIFPNFAAKVGNPGEDVHLPCTWSKLGLLEGALSRITSPMSNSTAGMPFELVATLQDDLCVKLSKFFH
eukprot:scaffold30910_cov18-Tisochrysis_lutea.AAC.1